MDDPSLNKAIAMLLQAFPNQAITIWQDPSGYRAGLISKPQSTTLPNPSSECRDDPNQAVLRLRVGLIERAQVSVNMTQTHLANLMVSPFAADQSESEAHTGDTK